MAIHINEESVHVLIVNHSRNIASPSQEAGPDVRIGVHHKPSVKLEPPSMEMFGQECFC